MIPGLRGAKENAAAGCGAWDAEGIIYGCVSSEKAV